MIRGDNSKIVCYESYDSSKQGVSRIENGTENQGYHKLNQKHGCIPDNQTQGDNKQYELKVLEVASHCLSLGWISNM